MLMGLGGGSQLRRVGGAELGSSGNQVFFRAATWIRLILILPVVWVALYGFMKWISPDFTLTGSDLVLGLAMLLPVFFGGWIGFFLPCSIEVRRDRLLLRVGGMTMAQFKRANLASLRLDDTGPDGPRLVVGFRYWGRKRGKISSVSYAVAESVDLVGLRHLVELLKPSALGDELGADALYERVGGAL